MLQPSCHKALERALLSIIAGKPLNWQSSIWLLIVATQTLQLHADALHLQWPATMVESAGLNAVHCIDPQHAWAVGERGAILFTKDGGTTWEVQVQPATGHSLCDVSFADEQNGVIVGGHAEPYELPSAGTVLRTRDGGQTWQSIDRTMLPCLHQLQHLDSRRLLAIGDASALFLSGIFRSQDGGRSWNCVPTGSQLDWAAGDLRESDLMLLITRDGQTAACASSEIVQPLPSPILDGLHLRDIAWVADNHALAVGDNGAVLHSFDSGKSWQQNPAFAEHPIAQHIDFYSVFAKQGLIWIVGSPGTHVFRSSDGGRTWDVSPTGQSLPLRSLDFSDPQHGIAVGDLGVSIVTDDAGATWTVTRGKDRRAGLLVLCDSPTEVPFDLIAQLSTIDQIRCHVVIAAADLERFTLAATAAKLVGADGVERFDSLEDTAKLTNRLVRRLITYRPEIVVISQTPESSTSANPLVDATIGALRIAAESDQIASCCGKAFDPWRVQRVFKSTALANTIPRPINIKTAEPIEALHSSIAAAVTEAQAYVGLGSRESSHWHEQQSVRGSLFVSLSQQVWPEQPMDVSLIGGLNLPFSSAAQRAMPETPANAASIQRRTATFHNSLSLIDRLIVSDHEGGNLEQLAPLTRELDPHEQSCLLLWAAERCHRNGRTDIAVETLNTMMQRRSADIYEQAATLQHLKYSTSAEIAQMLKQQSAAVASSSYAQTGTGVQSASFAPPAAVAIAVDATGKGGDSATSRPGDPEALKSLPPTVQALPWVRMMTAATLRQAASPKERSRIYKLVKNKLAGADWSRCAAVESWLADMKPDPRRIPPSVVIVDTVRVPPVLDGQLDDQVWQDASPLALVPTMATDQNDGRSTIVRLRETQPTFSCPSSAKGNTNPSALPHKHESVTPT